MQKLTKDNLNEFMDYFHKLHDSYFKEVNYDVKDSKVELLIDVCWSGKPTLKDDKTYETNKTKIRIALNNIVKISIKELFSWDYIKEAYIKNIVYENKECMCFASDSEDPLIYVVCDNIEYEEIK